MRMPQEQIVCLPDISKQVSEDNQVTIDFLLPNGVFLPLNVEFHQPLDLLKQRIWKSAEDFPLYNLLKCHDGYTFEYLNRNGEREDVLDESLRLSEVRPIGKFLRLKERQDGSRTQTLDKQILVLLGNKNAMELHSRPRTEVDDFRKKMDKFLAAKVPVKKNFQALFEVKFPLQLRSCEMFPEHLLNKVDNGYLAMTIRVKDTVSPKLIVSCHIHDSAEMAVDTAMRKWRNQSVRDTSDWVLKVVGREEYLYGKTPLFRFKYVYNCLQRSIAPDLWLVNQKKTLQTESSNNRQKPLPRLPPEVPISQYAHKDVTVWDINSNFEIKISNIVNIEITSDQVKDNIDKVKLCVGLYHGIEVLGDVKTTTELPVEKGNCRVDMTLDFDIPVKDVQAASRLCFTLNGRMKGAKSSNTIAWVNIPVFDFRSRLLIGQHKLAMWPVTAELQLEETGCYPIGSVSMNPHNTIVLNVTFSDYNCSPPIVFPSDEMITQCAADNMEANGMPGAPDWRPPQEKIYELDKIIMEEVFHEQDKETVWLMRYELRDENPYQLANVLKSVKWHNHVDVAKMQLLLFTWNEKLPVDYALELLDFNFPDKNVRKYAVDCLQDLGDDELFLYLLQLVQALKYENYLYCPLAEFLLERALSNQHIGHQLFWLLKSELHDPIVTIRFGLLLEAYLKASPDHMGVLYSQFECLNKLNAVSQLVKNEKNIKDEKSKEKALNNMKSVLEQKTYEVKLSNLCSPLSPLYNLRELKLDNCKFMDSKKRPLYLVWSNEDEEGQDIHIIYKNGDDLRQDMLTLQMLQVMDSLWQKDGLDLRMNVYNCVATGHEQGMIEVVRHSITLASIQKTRKATAFDKRTLFDWLKSVPVNKTEKELDQAVEEFTLSCAGYTVATYILGIGDRHNDNIMMKETGQIFHIDFGHFLGNFKSKFKIRRERVPFVLTSHFVYIITKGETQMENYKKFEDYCVKAYLTLRRNGPLLIRLFMMMLNSGIPQLSSVNDLDYIKDTLAVRLTDEEAIKQLKKQMKDALSAVSTSINWYIHNLAH